MEDGTTYAETCCGCLAMTDPLNSSVAVGRWFGIPLRLHATLLIYACYQLLNSALEKEQSVLQTAGWLLLLLLALFVHELGHALARSWYGEEPDVIRLWPLGDFQLPSRSLANLGENAWRVALAGPLLNVAVALAIAVGLYAFADATFIFNIFGNAQGTGAPLVASKVAGGARSIAQAFSVVWVLGWFGYWNWILFIANLIPALPFDAGVVLRSLTSRANYGSSRNSIFIPMAARTAGVLLVVVGLLKMLYGHFDVGVRLWVLAFLIEWIIRAESRQDEEAGFFDDTVFGYDFSEGYTSLEAGAATVRPIQESAIKRWRRRRSDDRRLRRQARESAQDRRMDEILDKLHREGKASLTDEETRFLNRVSRLIRDRPKSTPKDR